MARDSLSDAAEENVGQAGASVRPDDDDVGSESPGRSADHLVRRPREQLGHDANVPP
jgi:hypothetical protein